MQIRESSKNAYKGPISKFLLYLIAKQPDLVNADFLAKLNQIPSDAPTKTRKRLTSQALEEWARARRGVPPLVWKDISGPLMKRYFANLKDEKGEPAGKATKSTARSAVLHLFSRFDAVMEVETSAALTSLWKSIKRDYQDLKAAGKVKIDEGKSAVAMELWEKLMDYMLASDRPEAIFCHLYSLLSLNLGCRSGNTAGIMLVHFSGASDSVACQFMHQKNDQEGEMAEYLRHLFANPFLPSTCVVLSLGIYWACHGFDSEGFLFPGSRQDNRYLKALHSFVLALKVIMCCVVCVLLTFHFELKRMTLRLPAYDQR